MDYALVISVVALIATFYQAHIQRVHNEKSVKPLPQIDLMDRDGEMFVHLVNNGVGPMIINKLTFTKDGKKHDRIQECLTMDPSTYYHVDVSHTNMKVITPNGSLVIFAETFDAALDKEVISTFRRQLANVEIRAEGHDIYNNKIFVMKSLLWFSRHVRS